MITTIFSKSNPANYLIVGFLLVVSYIINEWRLVFLKNESFLIIESLVKITFLLIALFLANFIAKRNALSKDNSFVFLSLAVFLIFVPQTLADFKIITAFFFVLLAMRRILSVQSLTFVKEKIFDASLWVFVASLFHFWSILFILLVFTAILFHVAMDYRNWFLPLIALFAVGLLFTAICLILSQPFYLELFQQMKLDFSFKYFDTKMESATVILFAIFSVSLVVFYSLGIKKKPTSLQNNVLKIIFTWIIGVFLVLISPQKTNALLIFTMFPISIFAADFLENSSVKWFKESVSGLVILIALLIFIYG
jgi:hypothetical protein